MILASMPMWYSVKVKRCKGDWANDMTEKVDRRKKKPNLARPVKCRVAPPLLFMCSLSIPGLGHLRLGSVSSGPDPYTESLPNTVAKIDMVPIPGGEIEFQGKKTTIKAFFMAKTEVTWEAFDAFLKSGPPSKSYDQTVFGPDAVARPSKSYILPDLGWGHNGYPVINVSYTNVDMFCRWLSNVSKKKYRLPTQEEWIWACRASSDAPDVKSTDWCLENSDRTTHPVGRKSANGFGLFDMYGNAGEWATDSAGKPGLGGGSYLDPASSISPLSEKRWTPKWQETDPQMPKSRWWLSDGSFAGFRIVCEAEGQ